MSEDRGLPRAFRPGAFRLPPWLPSVIGAVAMLGLLGFAVVSLRPRDTHLAATPAPPLSTPPFLAGPGVPEPSAAGTPTSAAPRPRRTTPAPPILTGRFAVIDTYSDSFIGEVRVTNTSASARGWTVQLRFPASVGDLRNFWVEKAPRPTLKRAGDLLTFTSGTRVAAGKAVQLRFHFDREGSGVRPSSCAVNGTPCV